MYKLKSQIMLRICFLEFIFIIYLNFAKTLTQQNKKLFTKILLFRY